MKVMPGLVFATGSGATADRAEFGVITRPHNFKTALLYGRNPGVQDGMGLGSGFYSRRHREVHLESDLVRNRALVNNQKRHARYAIVECQSSEFRNDVYSSFTTAHLAARFRNASD